MDHPLDSGDIAAAVSVSLQQDVGDIRTRVRDLTLRALQFRRLEVDEIRGVLRAVAEGVSLGAEHRTGEVKEALAAAMSGLDDALVKVAQATRLALLELVSKSRDFGEHDLKRALDDLRITEQALFDILEQVADSAGSKVKQEFSDAVAHVRNSGTDTGASVKETLNELGNRLSATMQEGRNVGYEAAHALSDRLAALAGGILEGMAEALREKSGHERK